jgi:hypothetical protein
VVVLPAQPPQLAAGWAVRTQETVAAPARAYGRAAAELTDVPPPTGVSYFLVVAAFGGHAG